MATASAFCQPPCPRLPSPPFCLSSPPTQFRHRILSTAGIGLTSSKALPLDSLDVVLQEPDNALSLLTWSDHVSTLIVWYALYFRQSIQAIEVQFNEFRILSCICTASVTAMVLVWEYGDKSGFRAWKGLSWGMVPLLCGALCACTWHFFYNSESLEILVAIQSALTVIGNITMCFAAFRIYKASQEGSKTS